eukprot:TRINITY_DN8315_c0_g1_i1.p1 TRINITY_DN8315_c0_g1~~TRINITY_DN8315_c0_g1_i1.p1  ORF type:complete len:486 (-),score=92.05 TRINITY_DN8315_c0_g1_i1:987-2444(-)
MSFEETVDSDSLSIILSFFDARHHLPLLFVNKRWRDVTYKSSKERFPGSKRNLQSAIMCKSKKSGRRHRRLVVFWYSYYAAENLDLLKWCLDMKCPWHEETAARIALTGNLEALQWAIARNCPWHEGIIINAARKGHLDIIKWTLEEWKSYDIKKRMRGISNPCDDAARNGHTETFIWLYDNGFTRNKAPFQSQIIRKEKHLEIIEWLFQRGISFCYFRIKFEDLETANWIVQNKSRLPGVEFVAELPLKAEEYEAILTLNSQHGFISSLLLQRAAEEGIMDIFLIAERTGLLGKSSDSFYGNYSEGFYGDLLYYASRSNINLYKWLKKKFPPLPRKFAIDEWDFSISDLRWALQNGMEFNSDSLVGLVNKKNWEAAQVALQSGMKWRKVENFESPESLAFAVRNGFQLCQSYFIGQLLANHNNWERNNCKVLDYAHSIGCPWNKKKCFKKAIKNMWYDSARWIEGHSTVEERGGVSIRDILRDY